MLISNQWIILFLFLCLDHILAIISSDETGHWKCSVWILKNFTLPPWIIGWAKVYNPTESICSSDGLKWKKMLYDFKLSIKVKGKPCWTKMLCGEFCTGIYQKEQKIRLVEVKLLKWISGMWEKTRLWTNVSGEISIATIWEDGKNMPEVVWSWEKKNDFCFVEKSV